MDSADYGITLGFVVLFTFLFDMLDLKPAAGSYLFVRSLSYVIYLSFRAALGLVAVVALVQAGIVMPFFVMALVGTLSSLTLLQSLNFSVGGQKIATLEPLLARFRDDILSDNASRIGRNSTKRRYTAINRLASSLEETALKTEFEILVGQLSFSGEAIRDKLDVQLGKASGNNVWEGEIRRTAYAVAIVEAANTLNHPVLLEMIDKRHSIKRPRKWRSPLSRRRETDTPS